MKLAVIAGSGLASVTARIDGEARPWVPDGPPRAPAPGHRPEVVEGTLGGVPALGYLGRLHAYQGYTMAEVAQPVVEAAVWGADVVVVTNASGSLRAELASGELALIRDHINLMGDNPLRGASDFLDLSAAYDPELRRCALAVASGMSLRLRQVVYVGVAGPVFETPAEVRMLRMLGGDVVGMSSIPEVIMARRLGMRVLALTVIANRAGASASAEDVLAAAESRATKVADLIAGGG